MSLPAFDFHTPATLEDVFGLLAEHGSEAQLMAGGTDLLPSLESGKRHCRHLVWLRRVPALDTIAFDPRDGLRIGASALLADVMAAPAVREHYPALAAAIHTLATPQVRNKATLAGNLCNASPCADTAPPLLALDARVRLAARGGRRELALADFLLGPRRTALAPGEILESVLVPPPPPGLRSAFLKFSPRSRVDISAVSVAVAFRHDGGHARGVRIALGTVAPTPLRARAAESRLEGQPPDALAFAAAAAAARGECRPIDDFRASAVYKTHLAEVLTRRALQQAMETSA